MISMHLLLTALDCWNTLAISGSMSIIRSFWTATFWWRLSTCAFTHFAKRSSRTVAHTLAIHCFGVLGSSISGSGRYS